MKIYTKVVIDMDTLDTLEEESFEYDGPVALCGGGGGETSSTSGDPVYNARMANIQEAQQAMATEFQNLYKYGVTYDPTAKVTGYYDESGAFVKGAAPKSGGMEYLNQNTGKWMTGAEWRAYKAANPTATVAQIRKSEHPEYEQVDTTWGDIYGYDPNAQTSQLTVEQQQLKDSLELMPYTKDTAIAQTKLAGQQASEMSRLVPIQGKVARKYFNSALGGVDVNKRVNEARADVGSAFAGAEQRQAAVMGGYGINPNSGRARSEFSKTGLAYGKALAGASTAARTAAEAEEYQRLKDATSLTASSL